MLDPRNKDRREADLSKVGTGNRVGHAGHGHLFLARLSGSLARCRKRVRVRDLRAARLSVALQMRNLRQNSVPPPPLEDERRPLSTTGEARKGERLLSEWM